MFVFIKKMVIGLLTSIVNVSNHTNQQCMTHPTLINLHPNEHSQGLCYYPFVVNLDRCVGSCNTLNDLSNRVSVQNKTEDLNGLNELITLAKHISCECKSNFDGRKCNSNQKWNNDKCRCEFKNKRKHCGCEKDYIGIMQHAVVKMVNM